MSMQIKKKPCFKHFLLLNSNIVSIVVPIKQPRTSKNNKSN